MRTPSPQRGEGWGEGVRVPQIILRVPSPLILSFSPLGRRDAASALRRIRRTLSPARGEDQASIQRLDLDDRRAVVAADPEHWPRAAVIDEDAADIGRARQLIFGDG